MNPIWWMKIDYETCNIDNHMGTTETWSAMLLTVIIYNISFLSPTVAGKIIPVYQKKNRKKFFKLFALCQVGQRPVSCWLGKGRQSEA